MTVKLLLVLQNTLLECPAWPPLVRTGLPPTRPGHTMMGRLSSGDPGHRRLLEGPMSLWDSSSRPGADDCGENQSKGRLVRRLSRETSDKARGLAAGLSCSPPPLSPPRRAPHLLARKPRVPTWAAAPALASGAAVLGTGSRRWCCAHSDSPTRGLAEGWLSLEPAAFRLAAEPPSLSRAPRVESPAEAGRRGEAALAAVGVHAGGLGSRCDSPRLRERIALTRRPCRCVGRAGQQLLPAPHASVLAPGSRLRSPKLSQPGSPHSALTQSKDYQTAQRM